MSALGKGYRILIVCILLLGVGCDSGSNTAQVTSPSSSNFSAAVAKITSSAVEDAYHPDELPFTSQFRGTGPSTEIPAPIEGRIRIVAGSSRPDTRVHKSLIPGWTLLDSSMSSLPDIDVEVFQVASELVPVNRSVQTTGHPRWNLVVGVGSTWVDENGASRAGLPFALQQVNANCTHNGLLTFAYDQSSSTSQALVSIVSETCAYLQFDLWGLYEVSYSPHTIEQRESHVQRYRNYLDSKVPVKPIEELETQYPVIDATEVGSDLDQAYVSAIGLIFDGVHYADGCNTRSGPHPYCDSLHLPSYSLAKSLLAGLAYMRMRLLFPGIEEQNISDWVPECASYEQWMDVSFENVLDMATGNFRSAENHVDEESVKMTRFLFKKTYKQKIEAACDAYDRKVKPGTRWVYHTSDTFILMDAMQNYLRRMGDQSLDIFKDIVYAPVFKPLHLSDSSSSVLRTIDSKSLPLGGLGQTFVRDDFAKLTRFFIQGGQIAGDPVVDEQLLMAAMQNDPGDRGLRAIDNTFRYNNGFWAWNAGPLLGCPDAVWIPYMSGYGGITFALFPNQMAYYYVSDGYEFKWASAVVESHKIRSMCPEGHTD